MIALFSMCFSWLPLPLYLVVSAVFAIFAIIVFIHVLRFILDLLKFLVDITGGFLTKVVGFFV